MLKLLHSESKSIIGAATIVGVFSFASRVLGFIRDRVLAGAFGAGDTLDVYYAAFKIPDMLFTLLVVGALSASFIPLFTRYYSNPLRRKQAWAFTNNTLHLIVAGFLVLSVIIFLFAVPLSGLIAPGFAPHKQLAVAQFTRVMLFAQLFLAGSMIFGSVLQSLKRFALYAFAPILYNVGIIVGALFIVPSMGPIGLAWGVVLGAFLHFIIQLYGALHSGYVYQWSFKLLDPDTREVIRLTGPRMIGLAISQVLVVILTILATLLSPGSVTVFQFAYNIQFFAIGIVGVSFAVAAFPLFSEHLEKKDTRGFITVFSATVRQLLLLLIPLTLVFLILRAQIVRVVVGAGAFDWAATVQTADTLAFFVLTLIPQALVFLLARAFFALHDTVTPLVAGGVGAIVGILGALAFQGDFGVAALAIGYSLASIVNLVLLWVPLRQRIGSLDEMRITQTMFKLTVAGVFSALAMQSLKPLVVRVISLDTFLGVFAQGLIAGGIGLLVYGVVAYLLRTEELHDMLEGMRRKFLRRYTPEEAVVIDG